MSDAEIAARMFHEIYERLAPSFGYETRTDTQQFNPTTPNGKLMMAVCGEVIERLAAAPRAGVGWKLFETARDVVMASTQDATGRFYIEGDAEVMLGDLYAAVEEVRTAAPPAVSDPHAELVAAAYAYRAALEDEFTEKGVIEIERTRTALDEAAERLPDRDEWATEHMTAKEG